MARCRLGKASVSVNLICKRSVCARGLHTRVFVQDLMTPTSYIALVDDLDRGQSLARSSNRVARGWLTVGQTFLAEGGVQRHGDKLTLEESRAPAPSVARLPAGSKDLASETVALNEVTGGIIGGSKGTVYVRVLDTEVFPLTDETEPFSDEEPHSGLVVPGVPWNVVRVR